MRAEALPTEGQPAKPSGTETREPGRSQELTQWLVGLVNSRDYGRLAELRRPTISQNAHVEAGWKAGWNDEKRREVFEQVAFLFAVYHRGAGEPSWGYGSLGHSARRIGSGVGRGPDDAGAARLIDRIVSSRRPPLRHLQHAITRLRSCGEPPPSWARLADDLVRWTDREARIRYRWAVDFHAPPSRARAPRAVPTTPKDSLT